ncbi:MAG: anthranilate synthase component [Clostridiales bacterium]|jgi:anthranilate synthase component 1|nr:anthranilate synthase component [Clostridiales bacterium]MDK2934895.1 anthranilate synthase component [Clostridiales bacterium]
MFYPSFHEYKEWSMHSKIVPICFQTDADMETPISIFKKFAVGEYCYLFESVEGGEKWGRYSFMGRRPLALFKVVNGHTFLKIKDKEEHFENNPVEVLNALLSQFKSQTFSHLPRFYGGVVGYFSYDFVKYYEKIKSENCDEIGLPDCHLIIPEEVIAFDHLRQTICIIVNTIADSQEGTYHHSVEKIQRILKEISGEKKINRTVRDTADVQTSEFSCSVSKEEFCSNVNRAKEYIKNGDVFQVVLSQRLKTKFEGDPFEVYRKLRTLNPSPYMYFLKFDDYAIAGASPEMLVRAEKGLVETCPIAGTRPRGETPEEDQKLADELLQDEKEIAEHIMLVDLGRNDIGKVCKFGSVETQNLMHIEKYSHVMHMVTNVTGTQKDDKTAVDILTGVLPAGTVSGAPKVRAMEIIEEIENLKRGIYAGAIGYIGFDGTLDTCIAIRTAVFKNHCVYVQAGAGIVADSVPEKEYEETLNKAKALLRAIQKAGEI